VDSVFALVLVGLGVFVALRGVRALQTGEMRGTSDTVYTGGVAKGAGGFCVVFGSIVSVVGLATLLGG
jgi:hypothetical protein